MFLFRPSYTKKIQIIQSALVALVGILLPLWTEPGQQLPLASSLCVMRFPKMLNYYSKRGPRGKPMLLTALYQDGSSSINSGHNKTSQSQLVVRPCSP